MWVLNPQETNMKNWSIQNKSFFILFLILLLGSLTALFLSQTETGRKNPYEQKKQNESENIKIVRAQEVSGEIENVPDTSDWKLYTNKSLGLNFKIHPSWQVKSSGEKNGYFAYTISDEVLNSEFIFYVSLKDFYVMDGLPAEEAVLGGKPAKNVSGLLYGVKNGKFYFTFDIGQAISMKPEFTAMVRSINFDSIPD